MFVVLSRRYGVKQTTGCLVVFDEDRVVLNLKTLELPYLQNQHDISCIPEGWYRVYMLHSPKHGDCFHLIDVPDRDAILIHKGNYAAGSQVDTRGCILVGMKFVDINGDGNIDVAESTKAMNVLLETLPKQFKILVI